MLFHTTNSPFSPEQTELINKLLPTLTDTQKIWLCGYLSAHCGPESAKAAVPAVSSAVNDEPVNKEVTVLFGSQSGNSHNLAKKLTGRLQDTGFQVTLSSMSDFKTNTLKKVQRLLIVVSTHGEGEPPDNALTFHEFLHSKRAPGLQDMSFSVLALGDTSYELFCKTGQDFDRRLEELGARRLAPRVDCDVDFDESAEKWMSEVLDALQEGAGTSAAGNAGTAAVTAGSPASSEYSRSNPFHAEVLENLNLNGRGSDRKTQHLEISLEESNLAYEPGDSLGIYPENHPRLVEELIEAMGWNPEELVPLPKSEQEGSLREALTRYYEITVLTRPLLEQAASLTGSEPLLELLSAGREQELKDYIKGRDLLDLALDYSLKGTPAKAFVSLLRKMPARLYSISSSPKAYPDEVHVTIRKVSYESYGRMRYGVCSTYVSDRLEIGGRLPVFVQHNSNFKLPADPDTPIIMVGPGTGVAPFRAFLGEREEIQAKGKSWLFFGDQHFSTDFLYQTDWQRWLKNGLLTRMDVAFSRDTEQKVYVQHRMLEKSKDVYQWLQEGAVIYICGDEKKMAHDVHAALLTILEREGGLSPEAAKDYIANMQKEKRYQRDVY
ncbi:assimilatory sulfite reductase (NADPH) flavoprotein subunit [Paenibacillus doosanensis]|uniref:assimilatory sulfite reductase (NADPH) flavoprotein subunit n=1 Tax=Paenibacillus doosanensis TaxID=1229154 RepID=UPI0021802504|nr:assimilatory sulfite reductase (NADPH) flavoprotein subunit [Paenibacillus doosanensis]MCS7460533.1 assimilatory sulfite reductase (NADPH) flavoprotein subunit [Paenibacillus doosanensis]